MTLIMIRDDIVPEPRGRDFCCDICLSSLTSDSGEFGGRLHEVDSRDMVVSVTYGDWAANRGVKLVRKPPETGANVW